MQIAQYICPDPDALSAVVAIAELHGLMFKVTPPVVAVQVDSDETLAVLLRTYPAPSTVDIA